MPRLDRNRYRRLNAIVTFAVLGVLSFASNAVDQQLANAISNSDDAESHGEIFLEAATQLIAEKKCQISDFQENGGWIRSMNHKPKPIYFTYCGGYIRSNRVYIDTASGKIFR